jgi:hypothetical protein
VYEQNGTTIHEQAIGADLGGTLGVVRRFAVFGNNPGGGLVARLAVGKTIEKKGDAYVIDGKMTVRLRGFGDRGIIYEAGGVKQLLIHVGVAGPKPPPLDNPRIDPKRWVEVEITW